MLLRSRHISYNAVYVAIDTDLNLQAIQRDLGLAFLCCIPVLMKRSIADKEYLDQG
jgi:hypothetical protein